MQEKQIPVPEFTKPAKRRESSLEVLNRLKSYEKGPPREKRDPFLIEDGEDGLPVVKTIPEVNILKLLTKIDLLERRMQDSQAYLSFYYDMKSLEDKFLKMADQIEKHDFKVSNETKARIISTKERIEARSQKSKE